MPPVLSRPLKQSTIGIFEARTSDGLFKGFGLSNLQQVNQINLQGAHINNGNGDIIDKHSGECVWTRDKCSKVFILLQAFNDSDEV